MSDVIDLRSLLVGITTAVIACGGATTSDGSGGANAGSSSSSGDIGGGAGGSPSSGSGNGGATPVGTGNCNPAPVKTETVAYEAPMCSVDADAGDAGVPDAAACEPPNAFCERVCNFRPLEYQWRLYRDVQCRVVDTNAAIECRYEPKPCGRAHEGLPSFGTTSASAGGWLASAAWLEAASVTSFEILARELDAHGAPRELVVWAAKCADEERRHARTMTSLAERRHALVRTPPVPERATRALFDVLLENAVEGQIRETYGALAAWHQSLCADDDAVRAAMRIIADEETSHASLAWAIAAWGEARLAPADRARIDAARREAWTILLASLAEEPSDDCVRELGLPSAARARRMARELRHALADAA